MDFNIVLCFPMKKHNLSLVYYANIYTLSLFIVLHKNYVENKGKGRKCGPCS